MASSYYTQNSDSGRQPGTGISFSSWSGSGDESVILPPIQEPPVQYVEPQSDPNSTKLSKEHFRDAQSSAIPNTLPMGMTNGSNSKNEDDTSSAIMAVISLVVILVVIGAVVYAARTSGASTSPAAAPSSAFGSGGLSSNLLADLDFL